MKVLQAAILLLVYTAFTAGSAVVKHYCGSNCELAGLVHTMGEAGTLPAECTEKESVANPALEHRSGAAVKFALQSNYTFADHLFYRNQWTSFQPENVKPFTTSLALIPIYISNCVYLL